MGSAYQSEKPNIHITNNDFVILKTMNVILQNHSGTEGSVIKVYYIKKQSFTILDHRHVN